VSNPLTIFPEAVEINLSMDIMPCDCGLPIKTYYLKIEKCNGYYYDVWLNCNKCGCVYPIKTSREHIRFSGEVLINTWNYAKKLTKEISKAVNKFKFGEVPNGEVTKWRNDEAN
jgi:hypothetical protein